MNSWEIDYKALLKQIESQFRQSEQLLADNNINSPTEQPKLLKDERIWLPSDYIRTANYFREEYDLHALIDDVKVRSNIAYSLQSTDLLNFIVNRFHIGLSVGTVFSRIATLHVFSIIESIAYGCIQTAHNCCMRQKRVCKENKNCANYIKAAKNYSFQQAVVHLIHYGMLELSENEMEQLDDLRKLRNRVHMWLAKDSDFMDREISFGDYNQAIILLHTIRDSLRLRYKDQQAKLIFCKNKQV